MLNVNFTEFNEEVLITTDSIANVTKDDVQWLKRKALANTRERVRLCAHRSNDDAVHEMLIVHTKGTYVPPHKHPGKSESFHMIEGDLDVVVFDNDGNILQVINMGEYGSGSRFYWRLSDSNYHMVIPRSEVVVFHETTSGPFILETSKSLAPWCPDEQDKQGQLEFTTDVEARLLLI